LRGQGTSPIVTPRSLREESRLPRGSRRGARTSAGPSDKGGKLDVFRGLSEEGLGGRQAQGRGELAHDEKAFGPAVGIIAISGACWAIGSFQLLGIIYMPILRLIGFFLFTGIVHVVAAILFGGKGEFKQFFSPIGCAAFITWIAIIPIIGPLFGWLAGLWLLVPSVLAVERIYGLDRGKAIISVLAPVVLGLILFGILAVIGLSMLAILGR
jgi:hypothetical protein